jgi:L-amino acid N-acyltransferase YncA
MEIKELTAEDYSTVKAIYLEGIATGQATFQTEAPEWEAWDNSHLKHSRFVIAENGTVAGWAALSPVSSRCVYGGVAEISIYIAAKYRGKGIGHALLKALIQSSETNGIWTLQAGVFPENEASMRLHQQNGFRLVGIRERIGKMGNVWRDTALLERRSTITGIN